METYRDKDKEKQLPKRWNIRRSFVLALSCLLGISLICDGYFYNKIKHPFACNDIMYVLQGPDKIQCPSDTKSVIDGVGTNLLIGRCICK